MNATKTIMVASEMTQANGKTKARTPMKQLVAVVQRGDARFWTRIGVAFENRDGSWSLKFDFLPTDPQTTIQLRELRREEPEASPSEAQPGIIETHF